MHPGRAVKRAITPEAVKRARGKQFRIRFDRRFPYELDGGARPAVKKVRIKVHPSSVKICVPAKAVDGSSGA
jgi:diacylglycerol kinase family enzyme